MSRVVLTAVIPVAAVVLAGTSCSPGGYSGPLETVTVAAVPTELNALVYVAEDRGYFQENGILFELKDYDSGAAGAAGMLSGEADIAVAAEFPIVRQVFNKMDIVNFGTIAKYENTYIIWLADSGSRTIQDLRGKRIGVTLTTISEFYLGRTLELNGMNIEQVTLVDVKAPDSEKALAEGKVDAVVTWEPWADRINRRLGDKAITRAAQSAQYAYWNLVGSRGWVNNHRGTIERIVRALGQAEKYAAGNQDEAKAIVRELMNFEETYMDAIWPHYQFTLSLEQSMVIAMDDEARWMMGNKLTEDTVMPDFAAHIYADGMKAVKPEAVNIIR